METHFNIKILVIILLMLLLVTAMFGSLVLATLFSSSIPVDSNVIYSSIESNPTDFSYSHNAANLAFESAGEQITYTLTLENNSTEYFRYYYTLSLTSVTNALERAVLVYFDGDYLGTLNELTSNGEYRLNDDSYIAGSPSTVSHTITFELHIAADGSYFDAQTCGINITSYTSTCDSQKVVFVSSEEEFKQATYSVNLGESDANKSIIFTAPVTLTNSYVLSNPCTIDLYGNLLNLGGNTISLEMDGTLHLISSIAGDYSSVPTDNGSFQLNALTASFLPDDNVTEYAENAFTIATVDGIKQYDADAVRSFIYDKLSVGMGDGLCAGESANILGALYCYVLNGGITLTAQSDYSYNATNGVITAPASIDVTVSTYVTVEGVNLYFKLLGDGSVSKIDGEDGILNVELKHIPNVTYSIEGTEVVPEVTYDLFLPVNLPDRNATIEWVSSNANLMSTDGRIGTTSQGRVTLTALIRINNTVYTRTFTFFVARQSNEMRFRYLLALLNPIRLTDVYPADGAVYTLPVVDDTSPFDYRIVSGGSDLGLINIEYSIEPLYYFISITDEDSSSHVNDLYLTEATFQVYAEVTATGYFSSTERYVGTIGIVIELGENAELQNIVFEYVEGYLNNIDVLQNIIDTRVLYGMANEKGDFTLPVTYTGFSIQYTMPTVNNRLRAVVDNYLLENNGYAKLLAWATGSDNSITAISVVNSGLDDVNGVKRADGLATISTQEKDVLLAYGRNAGIAALTAWAKSITTETAGNYLENNLQESIRKNGLTAAAAQVVCDGTVTITSQEQEVIDSFVAYQGFYSLLDWATGSGTAAANTIVTGLDATASAFTADGLATISANENTVIAAYIEEAPHTAIIAWALSSTSNIEASTLVGALPVAELAYVNDGTANISANELAVFTAYDNDSLYTAIINWATGSSSNVTAQSIWSQVSSSHASYVSDGEATISAEEEVIILFYTLDRGYTLYSASWEEYITEIDTYNAQGGNRDYYYDLSNGIITNITVTADGCLVELNPEMFVETDTSVPIDVTVYMNNIETGQEMRTLYFTVPAAVHNDDNGFADQTIFDTVKLQIWQQLPQNEKIGLNIDTVNSSIVIDRTTDSSVVTVGTTDFSQWGYILVRDLRICDYLAFENGSPEQQFAALLGWASSLTNSGQRADAIFDGLTGTTQGAYTADGMVYISANEEAAIAAVCSAYSGFSATWDSATMEAYELNTARETAVTSAASTWLNTDLTDLTYTIDSVTDTFAEYMDWGRCTWSYTRGLTGTSYNLTMSDLGITGGGNTASTHGNTSVLQAGEITAILSSYAAVGYPEISAAWNAAIAQLELDTSIDLYIFKYGITDIDNATTLDGRDSATYKSYVFHYTGATTTVNNNTYTQGAMYYVEHTASYFFGQSNTYSLVQITSNNYCSEAELLSAIVANMKTIILSRFSSLLAWSTSRTSPAVSGVGYLSGTVQANNSDGRVTVSGDEYAVLADYWNSVIPPNYTGFATMWSTNVPMVTVYADTGIATLYNFYQNNQPVTTTVDLLSMSSKIAVGMSAVLLKADDTQIGSLYLYTGATSGNYTQNTYYELLYDATNGYYFSAVTITGTLTSVADIDDVLNDALLEHVGNNYLYQAASSGNYVQGYVYKLHYDETEGAYFFTWRRAQQLSTISGSTAFYFSYVVNMDSPCWGLAYATNVKELYVMGDMSGMVHVFSTASLGKIFFGRVTTYMTNLEKLVMSYCSLTDIEGISNLTNLNYIDLEGNEVLYSIGEISSLNVANIAYLNVHNTDVNFDHTRSIYANIYYSYYDAHASYPAIWCTSGGVETLYAENLSIQQITALSYLFNLKDIGRIEAPYLQLTTRLYAGASTYYTITWYEVSYSGSTRSETTINPISTGGSTYRYVNGQFGTGLSSTAVLCAKITVTVDGVQEEYFRDFEVELIG